MRKVQNRAYRDCNELRRILEKDSLCIYWQEIPMINSMTGEIITIGLKTNLQVENDTGIMTLVPFNIHDMQNPYIVKLTYKAYKRWRKAGYPIRFDNLSKEWEIYWPK